MRKLIIPALLVFAVPAAAHAETYRIKQNGMDIEYSVAMMPNGVKKITGTNNRTGEDFTLMANKRWVWGTVGRTDVSFRTPKPRSKPTELASN